MENKRNKFLSTLCILTFIGSGIGLLEAILGFYTFFTLNPSLILLNPGDYGDYSLLMFSAFLFGNGLCFSGAILMWKLRIKGFWFYLSGILLSLIGSIFRYIQRIEFEAAMNEIFGEMKKSGVGLDENTDSLPASIGLIFAIIFSGLFVFMYFKNKKQLQ
jgi:hypothetical protein